MQNYKTREFKKLLNNNGFMSVRQNGSHQIFERKLSLYETQSISIPATSTELNGCMAKRLIKQFHLK